jgi:hypothetical protein
MHFETHFIEKIFDEASAGEGLLRGSFCGRSPPKVATATEGGENGNLLEHLEGILEVTNEIINDNNASI